MAKRRSKGEEEGGLLFDLPLRPDTKPAFDEALSGNDAETGVDTFREPTVDSGAHGFEEDPDESGDDHGEEDGVGAEVVPIQTRLFQDEGDEEDENDGDDAEGDFGAEDEAIAPLADRLLGGVSDLAIHAAALGVAVGGSYALGVRVSSADWPPLTLLMLIFSFLYWTIPLAFWGQTPGMAWIGNVARSLDDEPLSFGQAIMRWVGSLLTLGFVGLPVLLSLGGRSLSDWLSESKTELV
jgi:hypothetical protein